MSRTHVVEGSCFVLRCTDVLTQEMIDKMQTLSGQLCNKPGGGGCAVYKPDGRKLFNDLPGDEESMLYADLDMDWIMEAKRFMDTSEHYSRLHLR
ncbi:hypothetical protein CPAR01_14519 [Colletotrichum paranaense]|uniref:Uncharacterized protein n=1 Tax=Colletotrichum paranaense TaxID=1914294 RepID=A0ABQ9S3C4_9PEZI|nr:uncharacterized protein CPAR01_14519 [Colletotrichum paranaense]KAK1522976.1 hypothetical protein CPAR01_14519 [Colletotrichum paranaense]